MAQTQPRFLSFEEYLSYDDGTEVLYELFNGELVAVPPESGSNVQALVSCSEVAITSPNVSNMKTEAFLNIGWSIQTRKLWWCCS